MENVSETRAVSSNQEGPYEHLDELVVKYASTQYRRPIAEHTYKAFETVEQFVCDFYNASSNQPSTVILDSGCGTGESTIHIALRNPGIPVIGIDKSTERLSKAGNISQLKYTSEKIPENVFWIRAELLDFWRLALNFVQNKKWNIPYHAVYFPNPWPKQSEATRRFHLHPIFPTLISLGLKTELRTNWKIYAQEIELASKRIFSIKNIPSQTSIQEYSPDFPETAFERKYKNAHQKLWRVIVEKQEQTNFVLPATL